MVSQSRSGAVGRARYKRREADRKRRDQLKALEQNAKYFDILRGAGSPDFPDASSGRLGSRGFTPRGQGWGYTTKVVSRDRSGERWGIDKIFYQYQEGFQHGGGKYVGQWGIRDAQVTYTSAEDWQRRINNAYWGRQSRDAEVQKIKDIQASIQPFDENNPYFSARTGKRGAAGRAAKAKSESSWGMGGVPQPGETKTETKVGEKGQSILDSVAKYKASNIITAGGRRIFSSQATTAEKLESEAAKAEKTKEAKYTARKDTKVQSYTTGLEGRLTWDQLKDEGADTPPEKRGGKKVKGETSGFVMTGDPQTSTRYFYVGDTKVPLTPAAFAYYKEQGLTPLTSKQYLGYTVGGENPSNFTQEELDRRDKQDALITDAWSMFEQYGGSGDGDESFKVKDGYMVAGKFVGDLSADALKTYAKAGTKVVKIGKLSLKDKDINKNLGNNIIEGKSEYVIKNSDFTADLSDPKQLSKFEKSTGVKIDKVGQATGNPFIVGGNFEGIEVKGVLEKAEDQVKVLDDERKQKFYSGLADRAKDKETGDIDPTYGFGSSWIGTDYSTINQSSFAQFGLGAAAPVVAAEDRDVTLENYDREIKDLEKQELRYQEILDKGTVVSDVPVTETKWDINTTAFGIEGSTKYNKFQKQLDSISKRQPGESDRRYESRLSRSDVKLDGPDGGKITISDAIERGWVTGVQVDTGKTREASVTFKKRIKVGEDPKTKRPVYDWQYTSKIIDPQTGQETTGYAYETAIKAGLMQESSKKKRLTDARSNFMTNEERLLKAEEINEQAAKMKEAKKFLKDYKPFSDAYGQEGSRYGSYTNYLNPEQIESWYARAQEAPRYAAQGVAGQYRSLLAGTGMYDVDLAENLRAGKITTVDKKQARYLTDEQAPGFSSADGQGMYSDGEGGIVFVGKDEKTRQLRQLGGVRRENLEEQQMAEAYWLARQKQKGQLQADYSEANQLLMAEKALDKRGRIRDPERYGQAIARVYYKTKEELPKLKEDIAQMELQIGTIRELKKQSDVKYSEYSKRIREKEESARTAYAKTGKVQFDDAFAKEIASFGDERVKLKLDKEIQEQQLDLLKKNVAATEEELEELRKQKSEWIPELSGGGGRIVNPARFARYQLLAGQRVTSAMSPGERSARQQVSRSASRQKGGRGAGTYAPRIIAQLGGTPGKRGQKTYTAYSRLAQLAYERGMMY